MKAQRVVLATPSKEVMGPGERQLTILILDGSDSARQTSESIHRALRADILSAPTLQALISLAVSAKPDILILAADHPDEEKRRARRILLEINPKLLVVRL